MDSYNDDIELLKQSPDENREDSTTSQLDSSLNPLDVIKRARYSDESIDQAPILALQTAFTSLQKIHNDEVKKNKKLVRENQSMKKALMDATQGNQPRYENQDMYDTQVAHAAGGTSEDESLAENRARQGHVNHLERELLITTNAVQKGNEEILRLKNSNEMLEEKIIKLLRNNEEFRSDNEEMSEALKNLNIEVSRKTLEIEQMKNALQSEQELNHNLKLKLESSQEQYDNLQRTGYSGQSEVQNLKLKLTQLENDLRKSYSASQFRELERKLKESEESKGILEAKCKQLEIECNIRSEQRQQEDSDDVDGDVETLKRALEILYVQQKEVKELKRKIEEQHEIIIQIQSTGLLKLFRGLFYLLILPISNSNQSLTGAYNEGLWSA
jgi:chromosome segregation ATPase